MLFPNQNWYGYNTANSRPTIGLEFDPDVPCYDITLSNVNLQTEDGDYVDWTCYNSYGSGACLHSSAATTNLATYTTVEQVLTVK